MSVPMSGQIGGIQLGVSALQTTIGYTPPPTVDEAAIRFAALGQATPRLLRDQLGTMLTMKRLSADARFNNPRTRGVMTSPPTVTISATKNAASTKNFRYQDAAKNVINYYGGQDAAVFGVLRTFPVATVNGGLAANGWRAEAIVDSIKPTINIYSSQANHTYRILVDGQYVSMTPTAPASLNVSNYIELDFTSVGGRAQRLITIEAQSSALLAGFWVGPTEGVYKPGVEVVRGYWVGDSYTDGTSNSNYVHDGFMHVMGDMLGIRDRWNGGVGGTGYLTTGGQLTARGRITDLIAAAPDVAFVCMGYNDSSFSQAQVTAECLLYFAAIRASAVLAKIPVFVFGDFAGRSGPSAAQLAVEAGIAAAVSQFADEKLIFIPVSADVNGPWLSGTGYTAATTGVGNADVYIGTDGIHPSAPAGYAFLGARCADAVIRALLTY
jgi:lysophospholipase L1-like esterase